METMYTYGFEEREALIFAGLKVYITGCLGEYLDEDQVNMLAEMLRKFRNRPAEVEFADNYCQPLTRDRSIRHKFIPRKTLRKDECAIFFYNVGPYALLNRNQTARFAKKLMPNFFSSELTINCSFTRHANLSTSELAKVSGLTIENLPSHTTAHVERTFFTLGLSNQNKRKCHERK